ncbi:MULTISPECIES: AAA family ATPase [unclassified Bradyrhizobium]|uniref:AAA family ATPase n=1 Tax=unclassified Bradyrhizobium TaxID=2631580 RepID=UPI001CD27517|nr:MULTISPECIES: AAA family ATPase [unclassified Bradyrhizobium]MCA1386083.1 AAA family ATPase [Bradyrhizobium sp. BRP05]MCA1393881.1 AAA family ATPase [Bradyrhizobium sp. IC3123]MCA1423525.1 AAA family ATPase [Bradyrhizobium sp. BRP23]MCA1431083.1 AAA family ATPase [Bradyrhizobium sp. NBAIM16]MCA1480092.1 AAA family ATPase [Bradyrhizobium sp. NBAIM08]
MKACLAKKVLILAAEGESDPGHLGACRGGTVQESFAAATDLKEDATCDMCGRQEGLELMHSQGIIHRNPGHGWFVARRSEYVSATVAPGALGKSSLIITEMLSMVSGQALLGTASEQLRVWHFNLEDPAMETTRRIQTTAKQFELSEHHLGDRLFVDHGRERPLVIAKTEGRDTVICTPVVDALIAEIEERGIDVVIVDPFISSHKVPENDNNAIDMVVKEWDKVADKGNCAVELVHHVRKGEQEVTVQSARGGVALTDGCRSARVLNSMTEAEAKNAGVDHHGLYFSAYADKANLTEPADKRDWFELVSVDLDNNPLSRVSGNPFDHLKGDDIGVATRWERPDLLAGVTASDFERCALAIKQGQWRADQRADGWVGIAVAKTLGLSLTDKQDRAKVVALLKTWRETGALVEVERPDERRKPKKFIEVADDD